MHTNIYEMNKKKKTLTLFSHRNDHGVIAKPATNSYCSFHLCQHGAFWWYVSVLLNEVADLAVLVSGID